MKKLANLVELVRKCFYVDKRRFQGSITDYHETGQMDTKLSMQYSIFTAETVLKSLSLFSGSLFNLDKFYPFFHECYYKVLHGLSLFVDTGIPKKPIKWRRIGVVEI